MDSPFSKFLQKAETFLSGWAFPVFSISLLLFTNLFFVVLLIFPGPQSPLASFANDFKVWCFGYNPETGSFEWAYFFMFFSGPILFILTFSLIWWKPLKEVFRESPRKVMPWVGSALSLVALSGFLLIGLYNPSPREEKYPFPAKSLRTTVPAQNFTLTNHEGHKVSLADFRGRVVMITGVYATCGYTCPMILKQVKAAVAALTEKERESLTILAITLDPERDKVEALKKMAQAQKVSVPLFHFLTGDSPKVNHTLDIYNFARKKDPKTGIISHSNNFHLIDRKGRMAYRFSLGKNQKEWLIEALKILIKEKGKAKEKPSGP